MSDTAGCFYCGKDIQLSDSACRHCGRPRIAPNCSHCQQPVTAYRGHRSNYTHRHGSYPWHYQWNGKCGSCGFEFTAEVNLRTGHTIQHAPQRDEHLKNLPDEPTAEEHFAGISKISIRRGDSVHMEFDLWDHQPTIEVRIRREVAANCGGPDAGLYAEDRIAMTPAEWATVIAQLQGPLKVLMQQEAWWEDTT